MYTTCTNCGDHAECVRVDSELSADVSYLCPSCEYDYVKEDQDTEQAMIEETRKALQSRVLP